MRARIEKRKPPKIRICITGGSGFVGTALVRTLVRRGYSASQLIVIDPTPPPKDLGRAVRHLKGRFADPRVLPEAFRRGDTIVHLGGTSNQATAERDPRVDAMRNIGDTLRLLEYAARIGIARFVFPSSAPAVYGRQRRLPITEAARCNPIAVHGATKLSLEHFIRYFARIGHFSHVILRAANVYGPGQLAETHGVVSRFAIRTLAGTPIEIWGTSAIARDFVYIDDFADAFVRCIEGRSMDATINIASGKAVTLGTLIAAIERCANQRATIVHLPVRTIDMPVTCFDARQARRLLGWKASTPIEEGIKQTITWLKKEAGAQRRRTRLS
jgi:UDP-glucose 4-epimerase